MIEHIKIFLPNGDLLGEHHVGKEGVTKAFFDKEDLSSLVVLQEENILRYHGFLYVTLSAYKEKTINA